MAALQFNSNIFEESYHEARLSGQTVQYRLLKEQINQTQIQINQIFDQYAEIMSHGVIKRKHDNIVFFFCK